MLRRPRDPFVPWLCSTRCTWLGHPLVLPSSRTRPRNKMDPSNLGFAGCAPAFSSFPQAILVATWAQTTPQLLRPPGRKLLVRQVGSSPQELSTSHCRAAWLLLASAASAFTLPSRSATRRPDTARIRSGSGPSAPKSFSAVSRTSTGVHRHPRPPPGWYDPPGSPAAPSPVAPETPAPHRVGLTSPRPPAPCSLGPPATSGRQLSPTNQAKHSRRSPAPTSPYSRTASRWPRLAALELQRAHARAPQSWPARCEKGPGCWLHSSSPTPAASIRACKAALRLLILPYLAKWMPQWRSASQGCRREARHYQSSASELPQ